MLRTALKLDYDDKISLDEAYWLYREVEREFGIVKGHYLGISQGVKERVGTAQMQEEDKGTLVECIGVLLPLGMNPVVQQEIREKRTFEGTLHAQSTDLLMRIGMYMGRFNNTGVTVLRGSVGP